MPAFTLSANCGLMHRSKNGSPGLFDHLVGALLENPRHVKAKRLGGLEVDRQHILGWCFHWQVDRPLASKDAINIGCRSPKIIGEVNSVGYQPTERSEETVRIDGRNTIASRQLRISSTSPVDSQASSIGLPRPACPTTSCSRWSRVPELRWCRWATAILPRHCKT
jgi:hypothetical protein